MSDHPEIPEQEQSLWEKPGTANVILGGLIAACIAVAIGGFVLAAQDKMDPHFTIDQFPVFYGAVGLISLSLIVLVGQHLRKIVMRDEDYYDSADDEEGQQT